MSKFLPLRFDLPAPADGRPDLLIIAGEHSGDEHASVMLDDLLAEQPDLKVACLGGKKLEDAGAQLLYDLTAVSIVGFIEVLCHYRFFKSLFDRMLDWIQSYQPKHICFVDYPGFNLRLANELAARGLSKKGGGAIGLSYYVSPQVWAWKPKRRFKMARVLNQLGVIFPFELDFFADTELATEFVGHPFVRETYQLPFSYDSGAPILLLPGSRSGAVGRIFPILLAGFRYAYNTQPNLKAMVVYPSEKILEQLKAIVSAQPDLEENVDFISNSALRKLPASAVLMSSGTMSLACALSAIPGAITYRLNPISYLIGRILVKVKYIGIANLLLDRPLYPEFIQSDATSQSLGKELLRALYDPILARDSATGAHELKKLLLSDKQVCAAKWLAQAVSESKK